MIVLEATRLWLLNAAEVSVAVVAVVACAFRVWLASAVSVAVVGVVDPAERA